MYKEFVPWRDQKEVECQKQISNWERQGHRVAVKPLPSEKPLFHFVTDTGWEGLIDLEYWFSSFMPELAVLSRYAYSPDQLENLFIHSIEPIKDLPDELNYQRIESYGFKKSTEIPKIIATVESQQGPVWLCQIDNILIGEAIPGGIDASTIPLLIQYCIGRSSIRLKLLKEISCGDVLLINTEINDVLISGKKIGRFHQQEEGYMFEEDYDDESEEFNENYDEDYEQNEDEQPEDTLNSQAVSFRQHVPVKLDFIIQQKKISVAELEEIYQGKLITFDQNADKNVIIAANGTIIAKGQIVWIEDRPGIEITEIREEVSRDVR